MAVDIIENTSQFEIGRVVRRMSDALNGGKASFAECLAMGLRNALPLTAIALIGFVAILLGLAVLIVPGVIFALAFSVTAPVRVTEHTGITETLSRSAELTRGHRMQIFALLVIYYVLTLAMGFSLRPLSQLPHFGPGGAMNSILVLMILSGFERIFLGLLLAAGVASIYYELRLVKEGYEPDRLAAVFA